MREAVLHIAKILFPFLVFVAAWEGVVYAELFPAYFFPSPFDVFSAFFDLLASGKLLQLVGLSLLHGALGFLAGTVAALALAAAAAILKPVEDFFFPLVSAAYPIPGIVWVPLALLWFGFSLTSIVFVVGLAAFFQVFYTALMGIKNINPVYMRAARSLNIRGTRYFWEIIVLGSFPFLLTGLRLAVGASWRIVIGAEMLMLTVDGLGKFIWGATEFFRYTNVFVGIIAIGIIGLLLQTVVLGAIEKRTVMRWY